MTSVISVVIADDQPLVRAGLVMLVEAQPDLQVVGEASDGAEAVALVQRHAPDVTLLDVRMPVLDGLGAARALGRDRTPGSPSTRVIMLTTFDDAEVVHAALSAGASGYLLKQAAPAELITAIRRVAAGDAWLDPGVTGPVIAALTRTLPPARTDALQEVLTSREREVLALLAEGLSNLEISQRLVVGEGTVKTHVSRILMKTGCRDRGGAIALAYRSGLVVSA